MQHQRDVRLDEETVRIPQAQMCVLFNKFKVTVSEHNKNVFDAKEFDPGASVRKFRTVHT